MPHQVRPPPGWLVLHRSVLRCTHHKRDDKALRACFRKFLSELALRLIIARKARSYKKSQPKFEGEPLQ